MEQADQDRLDWIRSKLKGGMSVTKGDVEWLLVQYDGLAEVTRVLLSDRDRALERINGSRRARVLAWALARVT